MCRRFPPLGNPLNRLRRRSITIRTLGGDVTVDAPYGLDCETGSWHSPVREAWGLEAHDRTSPELAERLCRTATATLSYEKCAQVASLWGSPVTDDSVIHGLVQKAGQRALEAQCQRERDAKVPALCQQLERQAARQCPADFSLVIMLDGWMVRERGQDWGLKPLGAKGDRVAWREQKTAIVFRLDHRAGTQSGRRMIVRKYVVTHRGDWDGLARRLRPEALRHGLCQAREVFIVADGGEWIWKLAAEQFPHARHVLDFYHASQHVWKLGNAVYGEGTTQARQWARKALHQIRHGEEKAYLRRVRRLLSARTLAGLEHEYARAAGQAKNYFVAHKDRMHYAETGRQGCPIGSGAMESTCSQLQNRFKRIGQFWTPQGKDRLLGLHLNYENGYEHPPLQQAA